MVKMIPKKLILLFLVVLLSGCLQPISTPTIAPYPVPEASQFTSPLSTLSPYPEPPIIPTAEFLPLPENTLILFPVFNDLPILGVEVWEGTAGAPTMLPYWQELRPDFVHMPILWSRIEIADDVWFWPKTYDRDVAELHKLGILPVLTLKAPPDWARTSTELCGRPDDVNEFAEFAAQVAAHYPSPIILELGNEPDAPEGINSQDWFGCWGNPNEPYFGGEWYRTLLDVTYPAIKKANPDALVMSGGLMMACLNCPMAEWIQAWGDSPNYDLLSFHNYTWSIEANTLDEYIHYLWLWSDRPLWLTETAVQANQCNNNAEHDKRSVEWAQIVRSDSRLAAVSWFTSQPNGWRCTDLLYSDWSKKPVYWEWQQ